MIHLDTNFLIALSVSATRESKRVAEWITNGEQLGVSSVAWAEFLCGPVSKEGAKKLVSLVGTPIPFHPEDTAVCAQLFNAAGRRRRTFVDCMIAATALAATAEIATNNVEDFQRFSPLGLRIAE